MMNTRDIETILVKNFNSAKVLVTDMTGTNDHFEVRLEWPGFQGKSLIEQHQLVNEALKEPLHDGRIHALSIKTIASGK